MIRRSLLKKSIKSFFKKHGMKRGAKQRTFRIIASNSVFPSTSSSMSTKQTNNSNDYDDENNNSNNNKNNNNNKETTVPLFSSKTLYRKVTNHSVMENNIEEKKSI